MIHTYSLVHDDLPAMDNDMYRRGQLTTHAKYGEAMGILAGDGLLNYAFEVMLSNSIDKENPNKHLKAINEIASGKHVIEDYSDNLHLRDYRKLILLKKLQKKLTRKLINQ